jgi:16S rRNA processing protein RimM
MSALPSRLILAGRIKGAHGVRGDVRVASFTETPDDLFTYGPLYDAGGLVLLTPVTARAANDHFIVRPKENLPKEHWDQLRGQDVYVPRDRFSEPDEGEFYVDDLVGLAVFGSPDQRVGEIIGVQDFGAGDLIEIQLDGQAATLLVPFDEADLDTLDFEARRVNVPDLHLWREPANGKPEKA